MILLRTALLLTLLLVPGTPGQRRKKPPQPLVPIDKIQPQVNFNPHQFSGTWLLVAVASKCSHLLESSHRSEATLMQVAVSSPGLAVNTFRKLDGICWQIKQKYGPTKLEGRYHLQGRRKRSSGVEVVVGETDYHQYAILYYQRDQQFSIKLYDYFIFPLVARSFPVSDDVLSRYEQRVTDAALSEDFTFYFPTYGFCDSSHDFQILDDMKS
ncbi:complement component C8 gamma chain isoform X2 [Dromiciops gliroides]|uniref:complement component C8 gamma chain isoform X2 n=1 Tax=Dromiciops gliroides TaxID=33562 RepID=UPI001CC6FF6D|nr:complement component C8 gamma chain isoform X2 [Dromiciops gliroides]